MSPALPKGVLDLRVLDLRVTGALVARIMDAHVSHRHTSMNTLLGLLGSSAHVSPALRVACTA